MTGLERIRRRVPLVVFVLLLVMAVLVIGFACACLGNQSAKAAERTLGAGLASLAVVEMWAALTVVAGLIAAPTVRLRAPTGRASPAQLQIFLR